MRRYLFALSCLASLLCVVDASAGYQHWKPARDRDGIRTWTLEIPGKDLPGFRGITTINATIEQIVQVMVEVESFPEWMWKCTESRRVRKVSDTQEVLYNRVAGIWPVWDRDGVIDVRWRYSPDNKALTFRFRNVEDPSEPARDGVVRIPRLEGFYRLWMEKPGKTNVLYQVEVDIGGNVPDFLARIYGRKMPFKTLQRLRDRVESRFKGG